MLLMSVFAAVAFARMLVSTIDNGVLRFGSQLEKDLRTGRTDVFIWKN